MVLDAGTPQEKRSERISAAVTPTEEKAARFVALARDTDVSNLLRHMSLSEILTEYRRMQAAINGEAA